MGRDPYFTVRRQRPLPVTPAPCCYAIGLGGHCSRRIGGKESFRKDEYENEECSHTPRRVDGGGGPAQGLPRNRITGYPGPWGRGRGLVHGPVAGAGAAGALLWLPRGLRGQTTFPEASRQGGSFQPSLALELRQDPSTLLPCLLPRVHPESV